MKIQSLLITICSLEWLALNRKCSTREKNHLESMWAKGKRFYELLFEIVTLTAFRYVKCVYVCFPFHHFSLSILRIPPLRVSINSVTWMESPFLLHLTLLLLLLLLLLLFPPGGNRKYSWVFQMSTRTGPGQIRSLVFHWWKQPLKQ